MVDVSQSAKMIGFLGVKTSLSLYPYIWGSNAKKAGQKPPHMGVAQKSV
jgi:hypothetical protein